MIRFDTHDLAGEVASAIVLMIIAAVFIVRASTVRLQEVLKL